MEAPALPDLRQDRTGWGPVKRLAVGLVALTAGLFLLSLGLLWGINTDPGRALLARQLANIAPESGLTVRIGRIDGSIFSRLTLRDVRIGDPQGTFAVIPVAKLDWEPAQLVLKRVIVHDLSAPQADWLRLPRLRPTARTGPIIPDIELQLDRLSIERIDIAPAVAGRAQIAVLMGKATIRGGRARIDALATTRDGGDRIALLLDAEPDRDRFDVDAELQAAVPGPIASLAGLKRPLALRLAGKGRWSDWKGVANARLGGAALADLAVEGVSGRFTVRGTAAPGLALGGVVQRLSDPALQVDATAFLTDREVETRVALTSPQVALVAQGTLDLADGRFDPLQADLRLLRPDALLRRASGRDVVVRLRAEGPFTRPALEYSATAPTFALATTVLRDLRITGKAQLDGGPVILPATLSISGLDGVGPFLKDLLRAATISGPFRLRGLDLSAERLTARTARIDGSAKAAIDLRTGRYEVLVAGAAPRYPVPGVGLVNVTTPGLRIAPAADGRNPQVTGPATARVIRLDSAFFRWLGEGLPTVTARLDIPPSGLITFNDASLTAPGLRLNGVATRTRDGVFRISAAGTARRFGPVRLDLLGPIAAPLIDVRLARPDYGIGLAQVAARFAPAPGGWTVVADGRTDYSPASLRGQLTTRPGQPLVVDIDRLALLGAEARGALRLTGEAFSGTLPLSGQGLSGEARLSPDDGIQRIDIGLTAADGRLALDTPIDAQRGRIDATLLLTPGAPRLTANVSGRGVTRDRLQLARADLDVRLVNGVGTVSGKASGAYGATFDADGRLELAPDRRALSGTGTIGGQPVRLPEPAVIRRDGAGWRLEPVRIGIAGGSADVEGRWGDGTEIKAQLAGVGLGLLDLVNPELELDGKATGTVVFAAPADGSLPRGRVNLRVAGFSRAGIAAISLPVDLGVGAALDGNAGAMRAVVERQGRIVGRAQAALRPIPGTRGDRWQERLLAAPLAGQLRFNGPAEALWPLAGIDGFDLRGPVAISADLGGRLGEPTISGAMRSRGARLESTVLGAVIDRIALDSRFDGSRLVIASLSGDAGKGGRISGSGSIDLSAVRGFPIDLQLQAARAEVIRRDDLRAAVTGPIRIRSDDSGRGGLISGDVTVDSARFRIGRSEVATVPNLPVRETGERPVQALARPRSPTSWQLRVDAKAADNVDITGLGLQSDWSAELTLRGPAEAPRIAGSADLVRGTYEFAGKRFDLTRGRIRFAGAYPPDPVLDIAAESRADGLTAQLRIEGTALKPEISFSSIPSLPEDEVLSRLLFGTGVTNLSAPEAIQLAGAVAALRQGNAQNLDVLGLVRRGLGIDRLRVLPGDTTKRRGTSVAVGEYVGNRVYVEVASDAQGYTATQIEVALTRSLSILSQVATFGGTSVNLKWSKDY